ncbi:TadE/TadG family type IV pilus assembly protein [Streptomyces fradiae]|uniref:TadE/TadG family type IV pilus assembly protein n=1 Tax=Streptomyces fradiae TaxID=1906 RepID=UPI0033FB6C02
MARARTKAPHSGRRRHRYGDVGHRYGAPRLPYGDGGHRYGDEGHRYGAPRLPYGVGGHRYGDRGQVAVEFTGMVPLVLGVLLLLWQAALIGYTYSLAGNAADEAARAGAVGGDCAAAAGSKLSGAWSASTSCGGAGDLFTADVSIRVPALFPGANLPFTVRAHAAAADERDPR